MPDMQNAERDVGGAGKRILIHRGFIVVCYAGVTDHRGARDEPWNRTSPIVRRMGR
jgi:hypothetical protein